MQFDPNNEIVKYCAEGMYAEGAGNLENAHALFLRAWNEASTDLERCIAAHYLARRQPTVADKLHWDETALRHALLAKHEGIQGLLPSLYLNIGKCHEDAGDLTMAKRNYEMASECAYSLGADGYGNMIKGGIQDGLERVKTASAV